MSRLRSLALGLALAFAAAGCSGVDDTAVSTVSCGDFATFKPVSGVLEQRCGTLDCHGQSARPLRIFAKNGLRRPLERDAGVVTNYAEYYPGGTEPLTDLELQDNFRSVCGLEPELMNQVTTGKAAPDELTLVRKMRLLEKHKGGRIFEPGRQGDLCITTWLTGKPDPGPCNDEVSHD